MPPLTAGRLSLALSLYADACSPGLRPAPTGESALSSDSAPTAPRRYGPGPRPAPLAGAHRQRVDMKDGARLENAWIDMPGGVRVPAYGPWDRQLRVRCSKR